FDFGRVRCMKVGMTSGFSTVCAVKGAPARALAERFAGFSWCPPTPRPRRALRPRHFRRAERQARHPNEITRGDDILRRRMRALHPEVAALPEAAGRLRPAEDFLDLTTAFLAELMRVRAHLHPEQPTVFQR